MARTNTTTKQQKPAEVFQLRKDDKPTRQAESQTHVYGSGIICDTESRGHATPRGRAPVEIVVDASEGFIPLWAKNMTLRWRFRDRSMTHFAKLTAVKNEIRKLFAEAILAWGPAVPVKFTEDEDVWDFEIVIKRADECRDGGCVLASSFFPDSGRHKFLIYPKMFTQSRKEQIDTLIHEMGHVFGLRHFFADVSETAWPSEIFGTHSKFSIMNYGSLSELTADDKSDLRRLYQLAWSGALTEINDTPIRLVKPYNTLSAASAPDALVAVSKVQASLPPQSGYAYISD